MYVSHSLIYIYPHLSELAHIDIKNEWHRRHGGGPHLQPWLLSEADPGDQHRNRHASGPADLSLLHGYSDRPPCRDDHTCAGIDGECQLVSEGLTLHNFCNLILIGALSNAIRFYYEFQKVKNSTAVENGQELKKTS